MIAEHAIILVVVLPLLVAPLCILLGRGVLAWIAATLAVWGSFGLALHLLHKVLTVGVQTYMLSGWEAPVGIEYRLDVAGALVMTVVTGIGSIVLPYSWKSVQKEIDEHRHHWFYACLLLCFAGLLGITVTGDAFNLFVFLEISSLSTYVLVSMGRDRRALMAAFRYLLLGTVGATFYLLGIGFLYQMTGTLNIADLAQRLTEVGPDGVTLVHQTTTVRAALAFLTVGLSLKIALFPLHVWLPNVYAYAPSVVSAFLSATATKVAILVLLRVFYTIDGKATPFESLPLAKTMVPLAIVGALVASFVAVYQRDIKRMLAYSSIAQVGYMVVGIGLATQAALSAGLLHLFNHALMKGTLFLAVGCIVYRVGQTRFEQLRGVGREMPLTSAALLIGGLSLIGVPLTAGFVSKWALLGAVLDDGRWFTAALLLL
ncbi:MAG TPA: monovalent cation/H+ antiporter subunit D family protein, partial [Planctomycetota bacterium]|nr:monovalent cation/H+ antiporter subunit D family protein [Planctomycetota bacterium]